MVTLGRFELSDLPFRKRPLYPAELQGLALVGADAVAIRTNYVTFRSLVSNKFQASAIAQSSHLVAFQSRIAVVEVHNVGRIFTATVSTWHIFKLS